MSNTVISFPIPAYSNVPIQPQFYQPNVFFISSITQGITTLVTTTTDQNFVIGQLIRFIIPQAFGIRQLNEQEGYVIRIISPTQVVVDINSTQMDPFQTSTFTTQPQILPVGNIANGAQNSNGRKDNGTFPPGAFINVSPFPP
jgi:hypothetical protein